MANQLKIFANQAAWQTEVDNLTLQCPNVSLLSDTGETKFTRQNPSTGIGIATTTGLYYSLAEWNALETKPTAAGVYVRSDDVRCILGNTVQNKTWSDPYSYEIAGCFLSSNQTLAKQNFTGEANTAAIMNKVGDGLNSAQAAQYCRSYNFGNGKTGYLLACGELFVVMQNFAAINACRTALGWTPLPENTWFWSSSQYNYDSSWTCSSSSVGYRNKDNSHSVLPACAL